MLGPDAEPEARHTAWPIPARVDAMPRTARRTLFVGDAAAATDVMTGEGIGQALLTGMLAAEAIEAAGPARRPASRPTHYDRAVDDHLVADHRMSALLVRALQHRKGARIGDPASPGLTPVDPAQLRPLAVRGLPPGAGRHAPALAPGHVHRCRRLPDLTRSGDER